MENESNQFQENFNKLLVPNVERDLLVEKIGFANQWAEKDQQSSIIGLKQMIDDLVGEASFLYSSNRGADAFYMEKICLAKTIVNDWGYLFKDLPESLTFFAQANDFLINIFNRTQICDLTKLEMQIDPNQEITQYAVLNSAKENLEKIIKVCDFNKDLLSYDQILGEKLQNIVDQCKSKLSQIDTYAQTKSDLENSPNETNNQSANTFQDDLTMLKGLKKIDLLPDAQKDICVQELNAELEFHLENLASGIKEDGNLGPNHLGSITDFLACVLDYLFYMQNSEKELGDLKAWLPKLREYLDPKQFVSVESMLKTNEAQQIYVEEIAALLLLNNLEALTNLMPIFFEFDEIGQELNTAYQHFAHVGETLLMKLKANEILVLQNFPDDSGFAPNTFGTYEDFINASKDTSAQQETSTEDESENR